MEPLFIVDVKKSDTDRSSQFKLSNGQTYGYATVLKMVETGRIRNVEVRELEDGAKYLYYDPETMTANDLYNVPKNLYDAPANDSLK